MDAVVMVMSNSASKKISRWIAVPARLLMTLIQKLRGSLEKNVPLGYEDETGFHVSANDPQHH